MRLDDGRVVPTFAKQALSGDPLTIHGDGKQTRCFTDVRDVVKAVDHLMNTPEAEGEIFNIGSEDPVTINELARKVKQLADSKSRIEHIPYEQVYGKGFEDMRRRTPNLDKLKNTINYEPQYTIEDILKQVIEYYRLPA
jgi:UDP-glucose 4-epimerase